MREPLHSEDLLPVVPNVPLPESENNYGNYYNTKNKKFCN
jgi:hypothetical protein